MKNIKFTFAFLSVITVLAIIVSFWKSYVLAIFGVVLLLLKMYLEQKEKNK